MVQTLIKQPYALHRIMQCSLLLLSILYCSPHSLHNLLHSLLHLIRHESSIIAKCAILFWLPGLRSTGLEFVKQLQCIAHFHSEQMSMQWRSFHICKPETLDKRCLKLDPQKMRNTALPPPKPWFKSFTFTNNMGVSAKQRVHQTFHCTSTDLS